MCIFFYVQKSFPSIAQVVWDRIKPVTKKINDFIEQLGVNFETILDGYFEEFKGKMKNMKRIPKLVVNHYYDDICFIVDIDYTYAQVVLPRVAWLRLMKYEVNREEIYAAIKTLLAKEIDKNAETFNTYKIA